MEAVLTLTALAAAVCLFHLGHRLGKRHGSRQGFRAGRKFRRRRDRRGRFQRY